MLHKKRPLPTGRGFKSLFQAGDLEAMACTRAGASRLATTLLAWLLEVAVGTKLLHHTFLIHNLLETAECFLHWLTTFNLNMDHDYLSPAFRGQGIGLVR